MKKKRKPPIIVLGAKGFIGNVVFRRLCKRYKKNVQGFSSKEIDLTRLDSVARLSKYCSSRTTLVVVSGIRSERDDSLEAFKQNIAMMVHVARAIQKQPIAHCIYISTVSVYGPKPKKGKITEHSPIILDSLYALAKYAGEKILEKVCKERNAPLLILRAPRVYGPGDGYATYGPSAFVNSIIRQGEIALYGKGKEEREFLYVEDMARIVEAGILTRVQGVVNVVSGVSHTFVQAVEILRRISKKSFSIRYLPRTGKSYGEYYDNTTFQSLFPDYSFTPFREGLARTIDQSRINSHRFQK